MDEKGMAANRRLAELLGWTEVVNVGGAWLGRPPGGAPASREQARVPDWSGDWRACGRLMAEHHMYPDEGRGMIRAGLHGEPGREWNLVYWAKVPYVLHADKDAALRQVIVSGVIAKLGARQ